MDKFTGRLACTQLEHELFQALRETEARVAELEESLRNGQHIHVTNDKGENTTLTVYDPKTISRLLNSSFVVAKTRPECLTDPSLTIYANSKRPRHEYLPPNEGSQLIEALQWMMINYDDVTLDYGIDYGLPYCHLIGAVKEG